MNIQYMTVIFLLLVSNLVLFILYKKSLKKQFKFVYNPDVIKNFEDWFNRAIRIYLSKFIETETGKQFLKLNEISINSEFVLNGSLKVSTDIAMSVPLYYDKYMKMLYGETRYNRMINDRVTQVLCTFVEEERKRRLSNNIVTQMNKLSNEKKKT